MMEQPNIDGDPRASLELLKIQVIERYKDDSDVAQLVFELEDRITRAKEALEQIVIPDNFSPLGDALVKLHGLLSL